MSLGFNPLVDLVSIADQYRGAGIMTYSEPMFRGDEDPWILRIPNGIPFGFFAPPSRRSAVMGMQG